MSHPFDELQAAVRTHDDWPTAATADTVIYAARNLVDAVQRQAEYVEHLRRTVTPTQEAIAAIMNSRPTAGE